MTNKDELPPSRIQQTLENAGFGNTDFNNPDLAAWYIRNNPDDDGKGPEPDPRQTPPPAPAVRTSGRTYAPRPRPSNSIGSWRSDERDKSNSEPSRSK